MSRQSALPPTLAPRLICPEAASAYLGVSVGKFNQMVDDGRMPKPKPIDRRLLWDVRALDVAIDELPVEADPVDDSWADVDAT